MTVTVIKPMRYMYIHLVMQLVILRYVCDMFENVEAQNPLPTFLTN